MQIKGRTPSGFIKIEGIPFMSQEVRERLREAGMSQGGIASLATGGPITDKQDLAIVASILNGVLEPTLGIFSEHAK